MDLNSTNGTYVNGVRVQRSELLPGDVLALGTEHLHVD
jgi:pSer/pThr/pTyr-binding forkhead associated (FHA) protein